MAIITGQKSIGFSNRPFDVPSTLPKPADDPSAVIDELVKRLADLETLVEGKADGSRVRSLIAYSDEDVLISGRNIVLAGDVTIVDIVNEQNGTTNGTVDATITRIIGDRIQTGSITSNNWGTTQGTAIDLDNETVTFGGSDNPALFFDGTDLFVAGTIDAGSIIAGTVTIGAGGTPLSTVESQAAAALPSADFTSTLQSNLDSGVANIIAGTGNDYSLEVTNSSIIAKHTDANEAGLGSSYVGDIRTGLFISAAGVAMGYNRKSDGAWIDAVTIESTGDVNILGTLTAGSIVAGSVTIDSGGTALSTVESNAADGLNIHDKLLSGGTAILTGVINPTNTGGVAVGSITWDSSTGALTGGTGVAITEFGIIGASSGSATFTIEAATGDATFAGELSAASGTFSGTLSAVDGTFEGDINTSGQVLATGSTTEGGIDSAIVGRGGSNVGLYGTTSTDNGVIGLATGSGGAGVQGIATNSGEIGVWARGGDTALKIESTAPSKAIIFDGLLGTKSLIEGSATFEDAIEFESTVTLTSGNLDLTGSNRIRVDRSAEFCTDETGADSSIILGSGSPSGQNTLLIQEGLAPEAVEGQLGIYGHNYSGDTTLGLVTEEAVVSGTGAFAGINQIVIAINGTLWNLPLQAV